MHESQHVARSVAVSTEPLGVYVHIPFCASRCGYCDFNTYAVASLGAQVPQDYLVGLGREISVAGEIVGPRSVPTVFFGGGTPTMLSAAQLSGALAQLRQGFEVSDSAEITIEANPETLSPSFLAQLRTAGFNRLSLGMQSASASVLRTLERAHSPGQAVQCVTWAQAAGFDSISLDLIFGTPGESMNAWRETLAVAISVQPNHLSAYSLIVEPGTRLARRVDSGLVAAVDDDELAEKYEVADDFLVAAGYQAYELSNWAQPGHECRHNLAYWHGGDWWGFGAGAHSHLNGLRWWNHKLPRRYLDAPTNPVAGYEHLDAAARHLETVLLTARLRPGVPLAELSENERARCVTIVDQGFGQIHGEHLQLNRRGWLIADALVRQITD